MKPNSFPFRVAVPTLLVVACGSLVQVRAGVVIIDDFNTGAISLSSANNVTDFQTEASLPPGSVIEGYRSSEITASGTSPTTIVSGTGNATISIPSGYIGNYIYFTYNNGQSSFPSTGLNLDLSEFVAFHLECPQLGTPASSAQLTILNSNGNQSVATKTLSTPGTLSFYPEDFTSGVFSNVHTVRLHLFITSRPEHLRVTILDSLSAEINDVPEPGSVGLFCGGLLLLAGRRRR